MKKKLQLKYVFYYIWAVYSISSIIFTDSEFAYVYPSVSGTCIMIFQSAVLGAMLIWVCLRNRHIKKTRLCIYILFLILVFFIESQITSGSFLIYTLLFISVPLLEFDEIVRFDIKVKIICLLFLFCMCALGLIENNTKITSHGVAKMAFGFSNPNTAGAFIYIILIEWLYIRSKKINMFEYGLILAAGCTVYLFTASKTVGYTFFLICFLFAINKLFPTIFYHRLFKFGFTWALPIAIFFSIFIAELYRKKNVVAMWVDGVMHGRILCAAQFIEKYGFNLFGTEITIIGSRQAELERVAKAVLDNAYVRCALSFGLIFLCAFCIGTVYVIRFLIQNRRMELVLFITFFIIIGLGEAYTIDPVFNISFLCLLGITISNVRKNKKEFG